MFWIYRKPNQFSYAVNNFLTAAVARNPHVTRARHETRVGSRTSTRSATVPYEYCTRTVAILSIGRGIQISYGTVGEQAGYMQQVRVPYGTLIKARVHRGTVFTRFGRAETY